MILFPNAKINIGLNIIRRRPDGYHDLETVMIPVPWRDILEIVPGHTDSDTLTLSGRPVDCPPEKNLVMKAVKALRNEVDFGPVDICLEKIIPDGAGLGGGSADAAFTLKGINQLFELGLDNSQLASIAASLGADCPFFIYNRPQLCTGTGTDLHPFDISLPAPLWIAIVKPDESVSTAEAYRGVRPATPAAPLAETLTQLPLSQWQGVVKNDFETSVFPTHQAIRQIKDTLLSQGAVYVAMSGSGSAVFALFDRADAFKPLSQWNCYLYNELHI